MCIHFFFYLYLREGKEGFAFRGESIAIISLFYHKAVSVSEANNNEELHYA